MRDEPKLSDSPKKSEILVNSVKNDLMPFLLIKLLLSLLAKSLNKYANLSFKRDSHNTGIEIRQKLIQFSWNI